MFEPNNHIITYYNKPLISAVSSKCSPFLLSVSRSRQVSWDVWTSAGFLCDTCLLAFCVILTCFLCDTCLLTSWSRVLLEKLTGFPSNQEIPRIKGVLLGNTMKKIHSASFSLLLVHVILISILSHKI